MTALCGGGTSSVKAGAALTISLSSDAIAAGLDLLGMPELVPVASLALAGLQIATDVYCTGDPPAAVTLTQQDLNDLVDYANPSVMGPALDRMRQWFLNWYWCQVCKCDSGAIPNCSPPNNPGSVGTNPGLPSAPTQACYSGHAIPTWTSAPINSTPVDYSGTTLPTSGPSFTFPLGVGQFPAGGVVWPIPANIKSVTVTTQQLQADPALAPGAGALLAFMTYDSASGRGYFYGFTTAGYGPYGPQTFSPGFDPTIWPTSATHWGIGYCAVHSLSSSPKPQSIDLVTSVQCSGPPLETPCCPPDPSIDARLSAILQLLQNLSIANPSHNSFAPGTTHSALSGSSIITLGKTTTGVQLHIRNISPTWPQNPQAAPYYYSLGFLTPFAITYAMRGQRITHNGQIFELPAEADQVGVDLAPGLVADLVELVPANR